MNLVVFFIGNNKVCFVIFMNKQIIACELEVCVEFGFKSRTHFDHRAAIETRYELGKFTDEKTKMHFSIIGFDQFSKMLARADKCVTIKDFEIEKSEETLRRGVLLVTPGSEMKKILDLKLFFKSNEKYKSKKAGFYKFEDICEDYLKSKGVLFVL